MSSNAFENIKSGLMDALEYSSGDRSHGRDHEVEVPVVNVKEVRERLALSQVEFAEAFGVSVATVRNWEQGRRVPRGPARALLMVIEKEPEAVQRALSNLVA